jgi:hypothetical protein
MSRQEKPDETTVGEPATAVNRRGLLRSGALIVGAAAAAAAALTGTTAAQAADGDTLLVGWSNEAGADRRVVHRPRAP